MRCIRIPTTQVDRAPICVECGAASKLRKFDLFAPAHLKLVRFPVDALAPARLSRRGDLDRPSETRSFPNSLAASLAVLPSMSLFPKAPFARSHGSVHSPLPIAALPSMSRDSIRSIRSIETRSLPTLTRSYPRRFTFYVADPISSIKRGRCKKRSILGKMLRARPR
jgi:hypothetical protein